MTGQAELAVSVFYPQQSLAAVTLVMYGMACGTLHVTGNLCFVRVPCGLPKELSDGPACSTKYRSDISKGAITSTIQTAIRICFKIVEPYRMMIGKVAA